MHIYNIYIFNIPYTHIYSIYTYIHIYTLKLYSTYTIYHIYIRYMNFISTSYVYISALRDLHAWITASAAAKKGLRAVASQASGEGALGTGPGLLLRGAPGHRLARDTETYIYVDVDLDVYMDMYIWIYIRICMYICINIRICIYVYICIYMDICIYGYIYRHLVLYLKESYLVSHIIL